MNEYCIKTIKNYPDNGKHQECWINLPFQIRKGEDGYYWTDNKGNEHKYNIFNDENKIDQRWIVHLTEDANHSLENIFEINVSEDLDEIIRYCVRLYKKSLEMELKRLHDELGNYCN